MSSIDVKYNDGDYHYGQVANAMIDSFVNEKELCDYIELNIENFCDDVLGVKYKSHKREFKLGNRKTKGSRRIDFLIKSVCGKHFIVECKKPRYTSELSDAVGQVLGYITMLESIHSIHASAFIVSSVIDWYLPAIVSRFNLPIGFICLDKTKFLVLKNGR